MKKNVLVLMTGGTIAQQVDSSGKMQIAKSVDDLVDTLDVSCNIDKHEFSARTGANLTFELVLSIRNYILQSIDKYDGFVLITGTDSMEELAFTLDMVLQIKQPLVLTGAMKPSDIIGYDGLSNLTQAIEVAADDAAANRGVMIVMNDNIHLARYVRKQDSQLIGAFTSHPGPVGQIRKGETHFYYENKRNPDFYNIAKTQNFVTNVQSVIFTLGLPLSQGMLKDCSGLVIAGMGTASISEEWIETLSSDWTSKIPIVLVSRCWQGTNYDDSYYRGSLKKYEEKGFILEPYKDLNIMQARIKLVMELSSKA